MTCKQYLCRAFLLLTLVISACAAQPIGVDVSSTSSASAVPVDGEETAGVESQTAEVPTGTPDQSDLAPEDSSTSCAGGKGRIREFEIPWEGEELTGRVYTPPCYDQQTNQYYPVLYLLHGDTETDQQWDDLGVDELADRLIAGGKIPPLLIVMPWEVTWVELPENPFGDQLVQGLIPWIERHYRAVPNRQHRAVGGLSRGGNWAVRLGLLHWGLFGSLGAHSTPLFFGDLKRVPGWLEAIPLDEIPRIYLDIGEGDNNLEEAQDFREILEDQGVNLEWHLSPGLHNETYWSSHLEEYLLWYSAGWSGE